MIRKAPHAGRTWKVWLNDDFREQLRLHGRVYVYVGVDRWDYGHGAKLTLSAKRPRKKAGRSR